jgi:hypothetical protein
MRAWRDFWLPGVVVACKSGSPPVLKAIELDALWIGKLTHCGQVIEIGIGFTGQLCSFRLKECSRAGDLGRETK